MNRFSWFCLIFLFGILCFTVGYFINNLSIGNTTAMSKYENCSNLSLSQTASCLRSELSNWYYYNYSNIGKDLTLEQLKKEGGVCTHYTAWYIKQMSDYGFYAQKVYIDLNGTYAHAFAVASMNNTYCILDQTIIKCVDLD